MNNKNRFISPKSALSCYLLILAVLTQATFSGCFLSISDLNDLNTAKTPPPPPVHVDVEPTPPPLSIASGWTEVTIIANSAKTRISTGAHFSTSRNACGHEAYGGLALDDWNKLATGVNLALQMPPLPEDHCLPIPNNPPYMDGTVEAKTTEGLTRILFQLKGDQICGTSQSIRASDELLGAITNIIAAADKEDCPNGWGSN